jgi:hypothetical protein
VCAALYSAGQPRYDSLVFAGARRNHPLLSPPDFTRRIPQLDGLRGVAIALVVLFHYINFAVDSGAPRILNFLVRPTNLGWSGVDLFFVLSGFLIGGILLDARESPNYFRVREHGNLRVRIVANYGPSPNCSQFYAFCFSTRRLRSIPRPC